MKYDSYRGVFNLDLLEGIVPSGLMGIPTVFRTDAVPSDLTPFDKAVSSRDYGSWVHFFIHDTQFQRIWRDPWRYLPILGRFAGVIAPDFSVMLDAVQPKTVVVYGSVRDEMTDAADHAGVSLVQREGATALVFSHKGAE